MLCNQLDTPALIVDLDVLERKIASLQAARDSGVFRIVVETPLPCGYCLEHSEMWIKGMSVEHGGMTTNLHDRIQAVRSGQVVGVWRVAGRGRSQ